MSSNRLTAMLDLARRHDASDVHVIANLPPAFRVGGEIIMAKADPVSQGELKAMATSALTEIQMQRFERERELCVSYRHQTCGRIRLSLYFRLGIPEMAIRMVNTKVRSAEELRLPAVIDEWAHLRSGLILITGPTGVGKTTTLNYIVDLVNSTRKCKIITIEDPVEFEHAHRKSIVVQIEVGTDAIGFAPCLRHVLRLDPDVICIGELRDMDTVATALTAGETGHLVIATLHTPSAAGAVERIVSLFGGDMQSQVRMQLSDILHGVLAQRLVPTVDKKHQVLAPEVLLCNSAIRNNIREGNFHQLQNSMVMARKEGCQLLVESLASLYRGGVITYDAALTHAPDPKEFKRLVGG